MCNGGTLTQNLFGDIQLSRILMNMHWWNLNTKSFRRFSAIKKSYWHALAGLKHKIFSAIFSCQEYLLTCIGGTWTQTLFGDVQLPRTLIELHWWDLDTNLFDEFKLSKMYIDMHWWDFTKKSFRRFSAIKNTQSHALMGPKHKFFSAICSDQEYLWMCIGGTLTQNLFGYFQLSRIFMNMHWWNLNTNAFRRFSAIKKTHWHALAGL